ncbi:MAG: patatin-like phospholipase family protein [Elusimicrobiota bacterium]|jgi:NTE family protein|nr:patatin-like phospholipase family protein [Elusimicrobiota bacterium]
MRLLFKSAIVISLFLSFSPSISLGQTNLDFNEDKFLVDILWDKFINLSKESRPSAALVLGGGGARGFAHIGVLEIMESEGVPIDLVVGTSMGSIVGALYCSGMPMANVRKLSENIKWGEISNLNIPSLFMMLISEDLLSNEDLEKFLNKNIGTIDFSDLKIPLICIATDLNTGERILLREGSVAFAARASATIPGIFKPVEYNQRYLVDGGLYENIPVDIARIFNPDIVITISVAADISKNSTSSVFNSLMQAIYIQGRVFDGENLAKSDIVISPSVGDVSATELNRASEVIRRGFIAGRQSIENVKMILINKTKGKELFE